MRIQAVTFDYWNTLVFEEGVDLRSHRIKLWMELFDKAGFKVEPDELGAAYAGAWLRYVDAWKSGRQFLGHDAADHILSELAIDMEPRVREDLIDAFALSGETAELQITDGIGNCLVTLKEAGISIGIICDVGFTPSVVLRSHLERQGLLEFFDHWSFSDEVGHYKPSSVIFDHALDGLGNPEPSLTAHVGDIRRTDIAGAKAMGMVAVRYTGVSDDDTQPEPEGHHVIAHHDELPGVLNLI